MWKVEREENRIAHHAELAMELRQQQVRAGKEAPGYSVDHFCYCYMYVSACSHVQQCLPCDRGRQERVLNPWELELQLM